MKTNKEYLSNIILCYSDSHSSEESQMQHRIPGKQGFQNIPTENILESNCFENNRGCHTEKNKIILNTSKPLQLKVKFYGDKQYLLLVIAPEGKKCLFPVFMFHCQYWKGLVVQKKTSNKVWSETKSLKGYTNSVSQKILQGDIIKIHNNHMGQREQSHNRRHWPRKDIY